jgi:predicted phage-related endonuclease
VRLEEVVAELFVEKTGLKVRRKNQTLFHKEYPFLGANIDRAVVSVGREREGLECKTCTSWKSKEWEGEEIPQEYIIQCHHYLAVTGWKRWHLAVLIGNEDFKVKTIERDEELLKAMIDKERVFWQEFVEPKIMPTLITAKDSDTLYQLFPQSQPETIQLGDDIAAVIEQRNASIRDVKTVETNIERLENIIKAALGSAEAGRAGQYLATWKTQTQSRLDQKKLAAEQPELVEKYKTSVSFRALRCVEVKGA